MKEVGELWISWFACERLTPRRVVLFLGISSPGEGLSLRVQRGSEMSKHQQI